MQTMETTIEQIWQYLLELFTQFVETIRELVTVLIAAAREVTRWIESEAADRGMTIDEYLGRWS